MRTNVGGDLRKNVDGRRSSPARRGGPQLSETIETLVLKDQSDERTTETGEKYRIIVGCSKKNDLMHASLLD